MNYIKIRERKRTNGRVYFFLDISRNGERRQEATGLYYTLNDKNKREIRHKADDLRFARERELESGYFGTSKMDIRSEEHTSELQSLRHLVCRLLLEKKKK